MSNELTMPQSRPGMYIATYDQKLDAASIYSNFLKAILDTLEFGLPDSIIIVASGSNFYITAINCKFNSVLEEPQHIPYIFNVENYQIPIFQDIYPSLIFLRSIVWLTEYCLVDISALNGTFRQAFMHGKPIGSMINTIQERSDKTKISFNFTISHKIFNDNLLNIARIKRVFSIWKSKWIFQNLPSLRVKWHIQSEEHFTIKIYS